MGMCRKNYLIGAAARRFPAWTLCLKIIGFGEPDHV
jgi:hypothetical protein